MSCTYFPYAPCETVASAAASRACCDSANLRLRARPRSEVSKACQADPLPWPACVARRSVSCAKASCWVARNVARVSPSSSSMGTASATRSATSRARPASAGRRMFAEATRRKEVTVCSTSPRATLECKASYAACSARFSFLARSSDLTSPSCAVPRRPLPAGMFARSAIRSALSKEDRASLDLPLTRKPSPSAAASFICVRGSVAYGRAAFRQRWD